MATANKRKGKKSFRTPQKGGTFSGDSYQNALILHRSGDLDAAEFLYRRILTENPVHAGALHFLGVLAHARGRSDEALRYMEKSILVGQPKAVFQNNYGAVLLAAGRKAEASIAFRKAVELDPKYADARTNLDMLQSANAKSARPDGARLTLEQEADSSETPKNRIGELFSRGMQLFQQEHFNEANHVFQEAASLPGGKELWRWKSLGFCPTIFDSEESIDRYWQQLDHSLDMAIDAKLKIDWRTLPFDGFTPSFNLPHHDKNCRPIKEKFAAIFEKAFPHDKPQLADTRKDRSKIRVGFIVPPGHHLGFIRVNRLILKNLDPNKFEIFLFGDARCHAECKKRVGRDDMSWLGFGNNFETTVTNIRDVRCDLVYHWKIGGSPFDYFLPFAKLAPVQCTSFGSHGTGGVTATDYYLSSKYVESADAQDHYAERLVTLDSYATAHEREPLVTATRKELGLPEEGALYFSPHRLAKYHPRFDGYMKGILERDPEGHIVLLTGNRPDLAKILGERFRRNLGDETAKRILMPSLMPHERYRSFYSVVTCVLDSPVYAGDLTAHDAFDYDVPVVSQEGAYLVERYTSGLYRRMNMDSLIVENEENYVDLAVRLGTDADFNTEVRQRIAVEKDTIFDADPVVKEYERFFESVVG